MLGEAGGNCLVWKGETNFREKENQFFKHFFLQMMIFLRKARHLNNKSFCK